MSTLILMPTFYRNVQNPSSAGTSTGTGYIAQPSSPGLDRHAQQAYYAPRAVSNPRPTVSPEVENPQQQQPSSPSSTVPTVLPSASASAAAVDDDSAGILPPPVTNSGRPASNIDPGKIGLLPKRPVSLVNTESQPSHAQDEEEELEYVENPFEEGKYS